MAAMDVQRLQQQLQTSQSRLAEESQQRRQLQAELEQVGALSLPWGRAFGSAGICRHSWTSQANLGCHVATRL